MPAFSGLWTGRVGDLVPYLRGKRPTMGESRMADPKVLTYGNYLRVDELLKLQVPKSDPVEHDEELFIVIHQVYELWFKLLLHELDKACRDLSANRLYDVLHTLKRVRMVLKTIVGQIDILETMTPTSFASFRSRLESASGFQSAQFRELEFVLGLKRESMLKHHEPDNEASQRLRARFETASIHSHFYDFLEFHDVPIPADLRSRPHTEPAAPSPTLQAELIKAYHEQPDVRGLIELLTDVDEGLQEWRYRHVKMVERTIGQLPGTGGSPGAAYLRETVFRSFFPDLWAIRDRL
jgi:tryptophan 2,3-dioxygenase